MDRFDTRSAHRGVEFGPGASEEPGPGRLDGLCPTRERDHVRNRWHWARPRRGESTRRPARRPAENESSRQVGRRGGSAGSSRSAASGGFDSPGTDLTSGCRADDLTELLRAGLGGPDRGEIRTVRADHDGRLVRFPCTGGITPARQDLLGNRLRCLIGRPVVWLPAVWVIEIERRRSVDFGCLWLAIVTDRGPL